MTADIVTPEDVKSLVTAKVSQCRTGGEGIEAHRYTCGGRGGPDALAASCDAAMILYVTGQLPQDRQTREQWIDYVNSFQDPATGWYVDDASVWVTEERLPSWLFGLAIRALNALGGQPKWPLQFLTEWADQDKLRQWILAGKDVMHLGIIWLKYLRGVLGARWNQFQRSFFEIIEADEKRFGPDRPAWQKVLDAGDDDALGRCVYKDAFHTLFVYYASGRQIPAIQENIDWYLNEQDAEGFFFSQGACAPVYSHMDGLQLLVELSQITDYRHREVLASVERALNAVLDKSGFQAIWDVDLHQLLARCETIAQAVRVLPDHPFAGHTWRCAWDLSLWKVSPGALPPSLARI